MALGLPMPQSGLYATLRWESSGPMPEVQGDPFAFGFPRSRLILLVPGYNVSLHKGHSLLHGFERRIRERCASLGPDIGWLLWPGDWSIPGIRAAAYPFKVCEADNVGKRVAAFLQRVPATPGGPLHVVLVAHSLGCRVVLEAVEVLRRSESPVRFSLFLMGAAVAVEDIETGGRLRAAALHAQERKVLHSTDDWVLHVAFRIGQAIAPEEAFWKGAVGTRGAPRDVFVDEKQMRGFSHGSYWSHIDSVRQFLAWIGKPIPQQPSERNLPYRSLPPPRRMLERRLNADC